MKVGQTLKLAGRNYIDGHAEHLRKDLEANLTKLYQTGDAVNTGLAEVVANKDLSDAGRKHGERQVGVKALTELQRFESTVIVTLAEREAGITKDLLGRSAGTPPKDAGERVAYELKLQEIRGLLRELPASERLSVYLTTSDPLTIAAIDTAPPTLSEKRADGSRKLEPFIDPAQRTEAVLSRAEKTEPETVKALREVQSLREVYQMVVNGLRTEILREVPGATAEAPTAA